jgi:hypothetical protein
MTDNGSTAMTVPELQALARRLTTKGTSPDLLRQVTELQDDCWLAARVIRSLLRHVNPSDAFSVFGPEGEGR